MVLQFSEFVHCADMITVLIFAGNQMASQSLSQKSVHGKSRIGGTRRTWKEPEEHCLLHALKELVTEGWKCDNGFKNGYLNTLEQAMAKKFPGCDLKGEPHIHSKVHVWKKQYSTISTMLSRSGFGWNSSSCTIDVPDDTIWNDYVKVDTYLFLHSAFNSKFNSLNNV